MSKESIFRVIGKISKNEYLIEITLINGIIKFDIYNNYYNTENSGYVSYIDQSLRYNITTRNVSDYDIYLNLLEEEFQE